MKEIYKEFMELVQLPDNEEKEKAMKAFFDKLNTMKLPEYFNWAEEIFEGIHVQERGDQDALVWLNTDTGEKRKFSYKEFAAEGNKLVNYLRGRDVKQGDSFYIMLPLIPEIWFATFATIKGGFVGVPAPTNMSARDLEFRFNMYPPEAILADENSAKVIDEAIEKTGVTPKEKIVIGERSGWTSYDDVRKEKSDAEGAKTKSDEIIFCFFSSGTTGLPKRVAHTATSYPVGHLITTMILNVQPGDVHNNLSAPGWAKYAWSTFFPPLSVGATTTGFYRSGPLQAEPYLEALEECKVNTFCAPPTAWRLFMATGDPTKFDLSSLRDIGSAGEPLNPELYHWWKEKTGTEIRDFYGQTESTCMIGNPPWNKGGKIVPGSFYKPTFMYDIILVDDNGNEIKEPNVEGHIVVRLDRWRPIGLFKEYMGNPEKMKEVFVGNYYYTGDKAFVDEKGYWWFVGRADDVIKSSDYRIGPFEVESALVEHPAVAEAAVVGSPDPVRYQLVKAFVILKPGYEPSADLALELFEHCRKLLAGYKMPRIIEFVTDLPKTISGKIKRKDLRKMEEENKKKGIRGEHEYYYEELRKK